MLKHLVPFFVATGMAFSAAAAADYTAMPLRARNAPPDGGKKFERLDPVPGGPHRIIEGTSSRAIAVPSSLSAPRSCA